MSQALAEQFIEALHTLERQSDAGPICALFAEDSVAQNPLGPACKGRDGVQRFWEDYRKSFGEIESSFSEVRVGDGFAVLEWTSKGTTAAGAPLEYEGVSVLALDGPAIFRFRTYFDTHPLRSKA